MRSSSSQKILVRNSTVKLAAITLLLGLTLTHLHSQECTANHLRENTEHEICKQTLHESEVSTFTVESEDQSRKLPLSKKESDSQLHHFKSSISLASTEYGQQVLERQQAQQSQVNVLSKGSAKLQQVLNTIEQDFPVLQAHQLLLTREESKHSFSYDSGISFKIKEGLDETQVRAKIPSYLDIVQNISEEDITKLRSHRLEDFLNTDKDIEAELSWHNGEQFSDSIKNQEFSFQIANKQLQNQRIQPPRNIVENQESNRQSDSELQETLNLNDGTPITVVQESLQENQLNEMHFSVLQAKGDSHLTQNQDFGNLKGNQLQNPDSATQESQIRELEKILSLSQQQITTAKDIQARETCSDKIYQQQYQADFQHPATSKYPLYPSPYEISSYLENKFQTKLNNQCASSLENLLRQQTFCLQDSYNQNPALGCKEFKNQIDGSENKFSETFNHVFQQAPSHENVQHSSNQNHPLVTQQSIQKAQSCPVDLELSYMSPGQSLDSSNNLKSNRRNLPYCEEKESFDSLLPFCKDSPNSLETFKQEAKCLSPKALPIKSAQNIDILTTCSHSLGEQLQFKQRNCNTLMEKLSPESEAQVNKSFKVFDVRDNQVWVRVLNIRDENDQERLKGHGFLSFLSPTYINFTISVAIFYAFLFIATFVTIFAYRSYSSLKEKFESLEKRNEELQRQNQQLQIEKKLSQKEVLQDFKESTQFDSEQQRYIQSAREQSFELRQQLKLALGDKAPYDFSSIETEEINQEEPTTRRSPNRENESFSSEFKSCKEYTPIQEQEQESVFYTPEKKIVEDPSVDNLTSSPRSRFLSHDAKLVSPKHLDFKAELLLVNCEAESLEYQSSQLQQPQFQTPMRQEKELDFSEPSLLKSQSSQPQSESHLLLESHDLKNLCLNKESLQSESDNFKTQSLNKSPIYIQDDQVDVNVRLQNKGIDFSRNLFQNQTASHDFNPTIQGANYPSLMNLDKLRQFLQNPVNDFYENQNSKFVPLQNQNAFPQLGKIQQYQYNQRNSANNQELQHRSHFDTNGQNRLIMTDRGVSQNSMPLHFQKFNSSHNGNMGSQNPGYSHQRFRGCDQKVQNQRQQNGRFYNQLKQKTLSLGRQAFQSAQYQPQIIQPRPTYGRNVSNHQSNVSVGSRVITPPFQIQPNIPPYPSIRSPQMLPQPLSELMQRGSFGSKESRPDFYSIPYSYNQDFQQQVQNTQIPQGQQYFNTQEQNILQQQQQLLQQQQEMDYRSVDSAQFGSSTYQLFNMSQMSQEEIFAANQYQQSFERTVISPLTIPFQNTQQFDDMMLKNQQSASPKCQQVQYMRDEYQFGLLNSNRSIENETNNEQLRYNFQQLPQYLQTGASFLSERHQSEDSKVINDGKTSLLYLENGRYMNSFFEMNFLGKGGFGVCYKVQHKLDLNFYAIKRIRMHLAQNQDIKDHKVYREIMALPKLNHKNVVRYFGCWAENIDHQQEIFIEQRVRQIQKKVKDQALLFKKGKSKGQKRMEQRFKSIKNQRKGDNDSYIFNVNEFDVEKDLDEHFRSKDKFSGDEDVESLPSSPMKSISGEDSDMDERSYVNDDESYEIDEESNDRSLLSHDEEEDESEDENCQEEKDDLVSEMDRKEGQNAISQMERDDQDSQGQVGLFDDDALFEFIKKDQQFVSIDMMIQMEYCSGDSLHDQLNQPGRQVDRYLNFQYFKQILNAVKHIHKNSLIHRDLKPANIFIEGDLLKVGDFGLARKFNINKSKLDKIGQAFSSANLKSPKFKQLQKQGLKQLVRSISQQSLLTSNVGTSTYLSPEQVLNKSYNEKVDIYALGLILCELCSSFSTEHERVLTLNDLKKHSKLPEKLIKLCPQEAEIILMMVNKNPDLRPSAEVLCKHELLGKWAKSVNAHAKHKFEKQSKSLQPGKENRDALQELEIQNLNLLQDPSLNIITEEQTDKSQYMTNSKYGDSLNNSFKLDSLNRINFKGSKTKMPKVSSHQDYNKFLNLEEQNDDCYFGIDTGFSHQKEN